MNIRLSPRYTHSIGRLAAVVAVALTLSACGDGSEPIAQRVDSRSHVSLNACPVPIADPMVSCGTLNVAENRGKADSRMIQLPFAVLPSQSLLRKTDPVVVYGGGPGSSTLLAIASLPAEMLAALPLRQRRDLIVMDQRGTALTQPGSLDCPELARDYAAGERFASAAEVAASATACRTRLTAQGVDLQAYDSRHSARDMDELRVLLGRQRGFTSWNVVATSYGTRLALTELAAHSDGLRSLVLDGPLPPQVNALHDAAVLDALDQLIVDCERSTPCADAYPDLRQRFVGAIDRLVQSPGWLADGTAVTGQRVLNAMRGLLAAGQAADLPMAMDLVARGALDAADRLLGFSQLIDLAPSTSGMYLSVMCRDEAGHPPVAGRVPSKGFGWPTAVRVAAATYETYPLASHICPAWTAGQDLPTIPTPARAALPVLLTVGEFDPLTPASNVDLVKAAMPQAQAVIFPGRGHGLLESDWCMLQVTASFVDNPAALPDTGCVEPETSLSFETPF